MERHKSNQGLKTLASTFDLLSQVNFLENILYVKTAFYFDNIRTSVWKEKFEYWIPGNSLRSSNNFVIVLLDYRHSLKAIPLLQTTVTALVNNESFEGQKESSYERYDKYGRLKKYKVSAKEVTQKKEKIKRLEEEFDPLMMLQVFPKLVMVRDISLIRR